MDKLEQEQVLFNSDEAAHFQTGLSGWVSRHGHYWGNDERAARYDGCTHVLCDDCGKPVDRGWLVCKACRENRDKARYEAMPEEEWNEVGMLYSDALEKYFASLEEIEEFCEDEGNKVSELRLIICEGQYLPLISDDYGCDVLAEDGELPDAAIDAVEKFNDAIKAAGPVSWYPGKKRLAPKGEEG